MTIRPVATAVAGVGLGLLGIGLLGTGCSKGEPQPPAATRGAPAATQFCDFADGPAAAAVQVVAYYPGRHEAALAAVKGLRQAFPQDVRVEIVDWRRPAGLQRRDASGLTCAGITINGKNAFDLEVDGKKAKVLFVRDIDGEWAEADLLAAVKQALGETMK